MTRKELNKLEMLKSVYAFLKANEALITGIPAMTTLLESLGSLLQQLDELAVVQESETDSATALKLQLEEQTAALLIKVIEALAAHAVATDDVVLESKAASTETDIKRLRANNLVVKSRYFLHLVEPYATKLEAYGVNANVIASLAERTDSFEESLRGKRSIQEKTISATQSIANSMIAASAMLTRIDKLLKPLCRQNPSFEQEYSVARKTIHIAASRKNGTAPEPMQA